jgi:Flp pilus assembly protein TadD
MYEMAVQFNPHCAEAHNNLGVIYKERDNLERAVECYTAALSVKPNFPQASPRQAGAKAAATVVIT